MWELHGLEGKVMQVLESAHSNVPGDHHLGRPYLSSYQIAIALNRQFADTVKAIGKPLGGRDIGQRNSLAQYLGQVMSQQVKSRGNNCRFEGAFLSNMDAKELSYAGPDGPIRSSLLDTEYDMAIFRAR